MKSVTRAAGLLIPFLLAASLGGCAREELPEPPLSADIASSIAELYRRSLGGVEIAKSEVLGKHYRSGRNAWKVVNCVEVTTSGSAPARDCNDSFELYRLDSGNWMISGTINGEYRWLQMP